MERALVEKLKNGTCDEIDKNMITARVFVALKKMFSLMRNFESYFKNLVEEYPDELKCGGFGFVLGVTEVTDLGEDIGIKIIYGSNKQVNNVFRNIKKEIEKMIYRNKICPKCGLKMKYLDKVGIYVCMDCGYEEE